MLPSTAPAKPMPKGPPTVAAPKPSPPTREQVQREVDAIMRDVEDKRAKRSKQQQQLHDDMLSAIFKSVFEDTVPDSAVGIYSSGEKDCMGCTIPKVIDFRSLPIPVQDNLMRAEILPTMWPRYRISGHERMFHYCLMTVTRKQMLLEAGSHSLSSAAIENMYPAVHDKEHREWINSIMYSPDGPPNAVDQLIYSAFECALSILKAAGSAVVLRRRGPALEAKMAFLQFVIFLSSGFLHTQALSVFCRGLQGQKSTRGIGLRKADKSCRGEKGYGETSWFELALVGAPPDPVWHLKWKGRLVGGVWSCGEGGWGGGYGERSEGWERGCLGG